MKFHTLITITILIISGYGYGEVLSGQNRALTEEYSRHLLPLPKKITVTETVTIPVKDLKITISNLETDAEKARTTAVMDFFKSRTQIVPQGDKFEIFVTIIKLIMQA